MTADTTAAVPSGAAVPAPGIYDIPASVYHADKTSLSSTGARKLLPPSCPAKFRYEQDHPQPRKKEFDFGTAAHQMILGSGPELVVVEVANWKTKESQAERETIYARGAIPLLPQEFEQVKAMAKALREHPVAGALFAEGSGVAEQSLYWRDRQTGVTRRARPDWLPYAHQGRLIVPDYKTTRDASEAALTKAIYDYGYFQQGAWYLDGVLSLGLADDAAFLLVFQEKTPPYLVNVVELHAVALRFGRELNRRALEIFAECSESGVWPGYGDDIKYLSLPPWAEKQLEEML
jgi:hypothetical protein